MRYWRRGLWASAVIATGAVAAVTVRDGLQATGPLLSVLGFFVSLAGLLYSTARAPAVTPPDELLDRSADALATAVREQWQAEWRLRRLQDPEPLAVHWMPAAAWLSDLDDSIGRPPQDGGCADLHGRLPEIAQLFGHVPSRRLVVLGAPGSGKTVLAVRFTLDLLDRREPGGPVPVVFQASTWRPDRQDLKQWLAESLIAAYPTLAAEGMSGSALAKDLVAEGRILPVLDGLDEMPAPLRTPAVWRLNTELDTGSPLLLTCRSTVYAEVVEAGDVLTSAAVVELQPLGFEEAARYLVRTARPVRGPDGRRTTAWGPVLEEVRRDPAAPASRCLRQVFSLPLMVAMARAVYGDTGADPAELLSRTDLADPAALERHLLDAFVPASFRTSTRWREDEAVHWLRFLARHLECRGARDLAWWELRTALPGPLRGAGPLLLIGALLELVCLVVWLGWDNPGPSVAGSAVVLGLCLGHVALSRDDAGPRRRLLLILAAVVPLGVVVGGTRSLAEDPYSGDPFTGMDDVLAWLTFGALYGVAVATALAAIGVARAPTPATMPFPALGSRRHGRWVWKVVGALGIGACVFYLAHTFSGFGNEETTQKSVLAATVIAVVLGVYGVRGEGADALQSADRRRGRRGVGQTRRFGRALAQGLGAGLLAGTVLGMGFALAEAGTAAARATVRAEFPIDATVHRSSDGGRYVVAADGTRYGVRPDGDTYVERAQPLTGVVIEYRDGDPYFDLADDGDPADQCEDSGDHAESCRPITAPMELSLGTAGISDVAVRLPDGRFAESDLMYGGVKDREWEWLARQDAGRLISTALSSGIYAGLGLGVAVGFAAGLHRWLGAPVDIARAQGPLASLRADRDTGIVRAFLSTVVGVFSAVLVVGGLSNGQSFAATIVFLPTGLIAFALSAWGHLLTTRLWLCTAGRLPWRLMTFLAEAHERGVLRQAGAVHQFRHARLQERLASTGEDEVRTASPPAPRPAP
ncbi:NACHT domain-containing protein [Streptomyces sp. CA-251387]|uniref:NACHT domain-containing protein n=1 Tax=Streptomyces sp. CA-251387 TaxID=3240064 RepID=UPI003D8E83A0